MLFLRRPSGLKSHPNKFTGKQSPDSSSFYQPQQREISSSDDESFFLAALVLGHDMVAISDNFMAREKQIIPSHRKDNEVDDFLSASPLRTSLTNYSGEVTLN
jgi:hypothetical protein